MRFSLPSCIGMALILATASCSRPAEESREPTPAQTENATSDRPTSPEQQPAEAGAAPAKGPERSASTPPASTATNQPPAAPASPPPATAAAPPPPAANKSTAPVTPAPQPVQPPQPPPPPPPVIVKVPTGTTLIVATSDAIATDKNKVGDVFTAAIAEPVVVDGKTVFPKGAKVQGKVQTLDEPGKVKGKAALSLVLTQVALKDKTYTIATDPFTAQADSNKKKDAGKVAGGAGIGAVVGAIAGGGKGAAIGAAIGGGAGTTAVLVTKGDQLKIEPETRINFVLKNGVDVQMSRSN
jgi:hypothetical protein